jgi:uncharacterized protein
MTSQFAASRVTGTPEAIELIESLKETHGPVAFFNAGPTCEGSEPLCLTRAELLPDPDDIRIGEVGGAPVYIEGTRYERWGRPEFVLDVADGPASGICLDGLEDRHFVTREEARRPAGAHQ